MSSPLMYFETSKVGEVSGSTSAKQLPDVPGLKQVKIKAVGDNAGNVYVGLSGVTVADGTTDTTTGWELASGEETPWLPVGNLNEIFIIGDNAGDDVLYIGLT